MDRAGNCGPPSFQDAGSLGGAASHFVANIRSRSATEPRNQIVTSSNLAKVGMRANVPPAIHLSQFFTDFGWSLYFGLFSCLSRGSRFIPTAVFRFRFRWSLLTSAATSRSGGTQRFNSNSRRVRESVWTFSMMTDSTCHWPLIFLRLLTLNSFRRRPAAS
jgi:hypothetical protein